MELSECSTLSLHDALPIYSVGLRSTRSISLCSAPSRKALSRLRYLFRPRTASWSIRGRDSGGAITPRSEEHTSELQSRGHLVCRLLLEKKNQNKQNK